MPPPSTLTEISKVLRSFTASSGWRTIMRPVSRPKNSSSERSFTVIRPLPGFRYTRGGGGYRSDCAGSLACTVLLNLERLGLLRLVGMLTACKHVQLPEHAPAERVLRQHALDRELDHALGVLAEKLVQSDRLDAADVSGMVVVDLVGELAPGDTDLLRIYHHDVVAHVHVRAVISLVLALEAMGNLRGQPPERLVAGVDDEPIAPDGTGPGKYGLHRENPGTAGAEKAGKCTQAGAAMQRDPCGPPRGV